MGIKSMVLQSFICLTSFCRIFSYTLSKFKKQKGKTGLQPKKQNKTKPGVNQEYIDLFTIELNMTKNHYDIELLACCEFLLSYNMQFSLLGYSLLTKKICEDSMVTIVWLSGKKSACQSRRHRFIPWVGKISWKEMV